MPAALLLGFVLTTGTMAQDLPTDRIDAICGPILDRMQELLAEGNPATVQEFFDSEAHAALIGDAEAYLYVVDMAGNGTLRASSAFPEFVGTSDFNAIEDMNGYVMHAEMLRQMETGLRGYDGHNWPNPESGSVERWVGRAEWSAPDNSRYLACWMPARML